MYAKKEQIKLEDSNMSLYGSDLHTELRKRAAETEEQFKGAGKEVGLEIWRVEKLAIKRWPEEEYGHFFDGDSFIVLRTYKGKDPVDPRKESDKLLYDVHFWLGSDTTQDEAGVAAYKTVELDDLLDDLPVQYREVQGSESGKFLSLFPKMEIFAGGIESGFNHVKAKEYVTRLLQCKGKKNMRVTMMPMTTDSLNDGDVFLLDAGMKLFQWNGPKSNVLERRKVNDLIDTIKIQRNSKPESRIIDGLEDDEEFWGLFEGKKPEKLAQADDDSEVKSNDKLWKLSDSTGVMELALIHEGGCPPRSFLHSRDVFLFDVGYQIFVFIGKDTSKDERKNAILYAMHYLDKMGYPVHTPIVRIVEGCVCPEFYNLFDGSGNGVSILDEEQKDGGKKAVRWQPTAMGSFEVTVNEIKDIPDVQLLGKQDPFVKVSFGKKKYKTETIENAGKAATFSSPAFKFAITGTDKDDPAIGIEVINENVLINSRICDTLLVLPEDLHKQTTPKQKWYDLTRKGSKPAGQISLTTVYVPPVTIQFHEAKGLRSTEMLTKQDPYVSVKFANLKFRTPVDTDGHKTPKWSEDNSFSFNMEMLPSTSARDGGETPVCHVHVRNKNNLMKNAEIAYMKFTVEELKKARSSSEKKWYKLQKDITDDKECGEILISFK